MKSEFEITDLGKMRYFLNVEVLQSSKSIHLCQKKYAKDVLDRFGMKECNSVKNPIVSRSKLTREDPMEEHLLSAKRVLQYLKGTLELSVFYAREGEIELFSYTNSDYASDYNHRKTEAKYVAAAACPCHSVWMKKVFSPSQTCQHYDKPLKLKSFVKLQELLGIKFLVEKLFARLEELDLDGFSLSSCELRGISSSTITSFTM
ncbi:hypothetical protein NC653_038717 [Populus alba x Populus x berolinensis]|uniref:Reverse transcriptase Ty1/copia-type domain-containing protein n=1 Tax=Populus alba x Populus x berolinensis TaxID=444605 RepID=A0AAD6LHE9_9ROSI|nr:hypothetical protein NC653_038717 [Populus alba x Populus x berolinensis]